MEKTEKKQYKVIDKGGASITQNEPFDAQNLSIGAVVELDPNAEQTIAMIENKTIAEVGTPEADAVHVNESDHSTSAMVDGVLIDKVTGEPVEQVAKDDEPENGIRATDPEGQE